MMVRATCNKRLQLPSDGDDWKLRSYKQGVRCVVLARDIVTWKMSSRDL